MRNRKLHTLLSLLDAEGRQAFAHYLASPLFGPSKTLQRFYALWRERLLESSSTKDYSPAEFLAGSKLRPDRMDKYCSGLYKKALDFLALREYLQSKSGQLGHGADALERRDAPRKMWEEQRLRLDTEIQAEADSSDKFLQQLQFKWKDSVTRVYSRQTQSLWKEDFRDLHQSLDAYYVLQKLRLACASANIKLIYKQGSDPASAFVDSFRAGAQAADLTPLARAYWYALEMLSAPGKAAHFEALYALLKQEGHGFGLEEASELFNYALNHCLRRGNQGEARYMEYAAALYRELLERGIILEKGKLPPQTMKNIVVIHCLVGEHDWVEGFLEEYKDRLLQGTDPNLLTYNEAVLAFYRQEYPSAIDKLKQVISRMKADIFYELDARTYLIKAYFEHLDQLSIEGVDEMYRMYDSFRMFIDRNQKISKEHKLRYGNFIREFRQFLKWREKEALHRDRIRELYRTVEGMEFMVNKSWFLEKLRTYLEPSA